MSLPRSGEAGCGGAVAAGVVGRQRRRRHWAAPALAEPAPGAVDGGCCVCGGACCGDRDQQDTGLRARIRSVPSPFHSASERGEHVVEPRDGIGGLAALDLVANRLGAGLRGGGCSRSCRGDRALRPARSIAPPASVVTSIWPPGWIGPVPIAPVAGEGSPTRLGRAMISSWRSTASVGIPL